MPQEWVALSYKVPTEPSRKRVYVWRKLKETGAVYLQQGIGLLPCCEAFVQELQKLRAEIIEMEGEAAVLSINFLNDEDECRLLGDFQALRDQEYHEIIDKCELLIAELAQETEVGKFTFAEIEENEEELAKIHRWLTKVIARDYFHAPGRQAAEAMIADATKRANDYAEEVYHREAWHSSSEPQGI